MDHATHRLGRERMGFRGFSVGSLVLVLLIVVVLFGTKRLREIGSDLGAAVRSFRKGMQDDVSIEEAKKDEHSL
jgi:sec-independent protein translocase protein TatA